MKLSKKQLRKILEEELNSLSLEEQGFLKRLGKGIGSFFKKTPSEESPTSDLTKSATTQYAREKPQAQEIPVADSDIVSTEPAPSKPSPAPVDFGSKPAPVDFGSSISATDLLNQAAAAEKQGNIQLAQQLRDKAESLEESFKATYVKWQKIIKG